MRGEEIRKGIDVYPVLTDEAKSHNKNGESLGKSKKAGVLAVGETALSRVLNATPIMVLPPLVLVRLQQMTWLKTRPRLVLPVNLGTVLTTPPGLLTLLTSFSLSSPHPFLPPTPEIIHYVSKLLQFFHLLLIKKGGWWEGKKIGLILTTSIFALPLALAAFPQRQAVAASSLEPEFWDKAGKDGMVEFNRGI